MESFDFKNMDSKAKIEIIVTFVMVIALILVLVNSLKVIFKSKKNKGSVPYVSADAFKEIIKRDVTAAENVSQGAGVDKYQKAIQDEDAMPWGRDPFSEKAALSGGSLAVSDLKLEGILFHYGNVPRAVINGEMVGEGDKLGPMTVNKISKDSVILTDGEKDYKLQL